MGQEKVFGGQLKFARGSQLIRAERLERSGRVAAGAEFLIAILELVELPVEAALGEQLLVGAALAKLAFVHDEDGVGALDGGEPVRDEDGGAAGDHAREREANAEFGVGVDGGGGFVEDEDAGVVGQRAGEADELFLAGGESGAALADRLCELQRQGADEVADVDLVGGAFEALVGDPCRAEADVVGDGAGEEERILQDDAEALAKLLRSCSRTSTPSTRMLPRWMS